MGPISTDIGIFVSIAFGPACRGFDVVSIAFVLENVVDDFDDNTPGLRFALNGFIMYVVTFLSQSCFGGAKRRHFCLERARGCNKNDIFVSSVFGGFLGGLPGFPVHD